MKLLRKAALSLCLTALLTSLVAFVALDSSTASANDTPSWKPQAPADISGNLKQTDPRERDLAASLFSWRTFVALNWPAAPRKRGQPLGSASLDSQGPRVWETWKEPYEVYLKSGKRPARWEIEVPPPGSNQKLGRKALVRETKVSDVLDQSVQATQADGRIPPILTDQNGKIVRYEIRMNRTVFDHILSNNLYDGEVQAATDTVSYPDGACLIKASWKEIVPAEAQQFVSAPCLVYDQEQPREALMGLVGFHIMIKTPSAPQWVWATFEQVNNVTGPHASFFNPAYSEKTQNLQTVAGIPSQVTRTVPIPDWLQAVNARMQKDLAARGSALQHYELVETQRPVAQDRPAGLPSTVFSVEPPLLSNTTQETFIQKSSCMGCHAMAATLNDHKFVSGDFTFTLNDAWPKPEPLGVIAAPSEPQTEWDKKNWPKVQRGADLAFHTYEKLPDYVGSKLHCASCHLDAGRNQTASWWVGMPEDYDYPATDRLNDRINQCFTHSMNGKALTSSAQPKNPDMEALLAYIVWINNQSNAKQKSTRGFPPISELSGDPQRGQTLYQQKCIFCHNTEGQGRYLEGFYFRPALWGHGSFPSRAGMADTETLAAFIKANMPLGSGGMLTEQEAWDLASYVESQKRP